MNSVQIIDREYRRTLVIEAKVKDPPCCEEHTSQEWRESRNLGSDISVTYALVLLEQHEAEFPRSAPFRLVEYVTESKTTMEVL